MKQISIYFNKKFITILNYWFFRFGINMAKKVVLTACRLLISREVSKRVSNFIFGYGQ